MTQKTIDKYANIGLTKERLTELFCAEAYSMPEIGSMYNISGSVVFALIKSLNIVRSAKDEQRYRDKMAAAQAIRQSDPEFQARKRAKYRDEHGYDSWHASPEGRAKLSAVQKLKSTKEKIQQTCLEKYGNTSYSGSEHFYTELAQQREKAKQTCRERYGTDYWTQSSAGKEFLAEHIDEHNAKVAQTCLARYGTTNPNELQEIKDKIATTKIERYGAVYIDEFNDRIKATKLARYGDENFTNPVQMKATKRVRYGDENYVNSEKALQTRAQNCGTIEESYRRGVELTKQNLHARYGDDLAPYYSELIKRGWATRDAKNGSREQTVHNQLAIAASNLGLDSIEAYFDWWTQQRLATERERYGVKNHYQNVEKYRKTVIDKWGSFEAMKTAATKRCEQTMLERYGVMNSFQLPSVKLAYSAHSKVNIAFAQQLASYGIDYEEEFPLDRKLYDFRVGKTLIEINPTATHNSTYSVFSKDAPPLKSDYHLQKSELARLNNYHCIHVWDWDEWSKICMLLIPKQTIGARCCKVVDISDNQLLTDQFINENHIQGQCRGTLVSLALIYDEAIVEVMTFGKPRYNSNYQWELLRLCSSASYCIMGGASKLFSYFLAHYHPTSIISYCDNSKFSGAVYTWLGMTHVTSGHPTKHWSYIKDPTVHVTDNLLRQRGFDQLFGSKFGCYGKGTDNEELMLKHDFVTVHDCGQSVYDWHSS